MALRTELLATAQTRQDASPVRGDIFVDRGGWRFQSSVRSDIKFAGGIDVQSMERMICRSYGAWVAFEDWLPTNMPLLTELLASAQVPRDASPSEYLCRILCLTRSRSATAAKAPKRFHGPRARAN